MYYFRNQDLQEVILEKEGNVHLRFAIVNGFRNIQNLIQKLKRQKCLYDFVEVMACPSGKAMFPETFGTFYVIRNYVIIKLNLKTVSSIMLQHPMLSGW